MNILIIGGGGREHALAWKCAQSSTVETVFVAPGNPGTAQEPKCENVAVGVTDIPALLALAKARNVDLTIVGPEAPLVEGVVDTFTQAGLACFGPTKLAAQLEGSKAYCKDFLKRYNIPTAEYENFETLEPALVYLQDKPMPIVIKADGLAAGKGVIIAESLEEAEDTVKDMLSGNAFGDAGCRVVIEEFLEGEEASFIVMADGKNVLPLATSQDHKARFEGDTGPNTGGMGAYSPAPIVSNELFQKAIDQVIMPTIEGMQQEGAPYTGFLYAGLMIDKQGNLKVLEFNCRFGDPETQPILMRMQSDLVEHCQAAIAQKLDQAQASWHQQAALGVILAAKGYPASAQKGDKIFGLSKQTDNVKVFHAGTKQQDDNIVTAGGRVLCVTAMANTIADAQTLAYQHVENISWDGMCYRTDIGFKAL